MFAASPMRALSTSVNSKLVSKTLRAGIKLSEGLNASQKTDMLKMRICKKEKSIFTMQCRHLTNSYSVWMNNLRRFILLWNCCLHQRPLYRDISFLRFCYYVIPKIEALPMSRPPYLNQSQTKENDPLKISDCINSFLLVGWLNPGQIKKFCVFI